MPLFLNAQTDKALELLNKFEKIAGNHLNLNDKYMKVLSNYGRDLETVRKLYQKGKDDPPVPRNFPPVAGKITWARQLYRKIDIPMRAFKKKPEILRVRLWFFVLFVLYYYVLKSKFHLCSICEAPYRVWF